ncbi:MAG: hypothetical protein K2P42_18270 [Lachnospiraceae bacterium]|nr:hypothetical protein [Lachnospiraceae bacterium]
MELELRDHKQCLTYEREHNPGRMPLKIDLLIIKKRHDIVIKNDIADFFLGNNILEYKSPGDDVNAGTFTRRCVWEAGESPRSLIIVSRNPPVPVGTASR